MVVAREQQVLQPQRGQQWQKKTVVVFVVVVALASEGAVSKDAVERPASSLLLVSVVQQG